MISKESKPKVYERAGGSMVEFYLPPNEQYKKGHVVPWSINGYEGRAIVGQRNTLPKDVVDHLKTCRSTSAVVDHRRYDPSRYGVPRPEKDHDDPIITQEYQQDFDIEILSEK